MKISDFAGCLRTITLTLPNGTRVEARELSAADDRAIKAAMPPPAAPLGKDPNKGSSAPPVPQNDDPGFVAAFNVWFSRRAIVRLACAIGWKDENGRAWDRHAAADEMAGWCDAAFESLTAGISVVDLDRLNAEYNAGSEKNMEGVGLGNSGTGSAPAPA